MRRGERGITVLRHGCPGGVGQGRVQGAPDLSGEVAGGGGGGRDLLYCSH